MMNMPTKDKEFANARPLAPTVPVSSGQPSAVTPHAPADHPALPTAKIGVLLVNLGTPEGTDKKSVRKYLKEFLSDRRVVDYPRLLWMPLLHGIILNTRPAKTGRAYAKIWREDTNESPLRFFTRAQADHLTKALHPDQREAADGPLVIDWAMRYGVPSIADRLSALTEKGCTRILILPLYPQYSATTTGTVNDEVFRSLMAMAWQPAVRTVPAFHDEPAYIDALAAVTRRHMASSDFEADRVILSFHGLPERYFREGDPYHCHCAKTARLLREKMGWSDSFAPLAFQSQFGPEKWLGPSTDEEIERAASDGVKRLAVITPGFVADCIETLEEIAMEGADTFLEAGGEAFTAIPCLNDTAEMTTLLEKLVARELKGWC
ncbi:MAG: ferrochelatase [Pseudomonadota bacterium]